MNWEKLKSSHYQSEPVEHVYAQTIFDIKEYDDLYENMNNLSHKSWKDFDEKYRLGFELLDDIKDFNKDKPIICLWFFKDRGDRSAGEDIKLAGKTITYYPNTFFITASNDIKIQENKKFIHRPALQIDLSTESWNKILERFSEIGARLI